MIAQHWTEQRFCPHTEMRPFRYACSNGVMQIKRACVACGSTGGRGAERNSEHPQRDSYPLLERHPDPCVCHPRQTARDVLTQLNAAVNDTTRNSDDRRSAYESYLQSPEWKERRAYMIGRALNRCEMCGTPGGPGGSGLQVHHRTYARLGREFDADLKVLCDACHHDHHDRLKRRRTQQRDMRDAA